MDLQTDDLQHWCGSCLFVRKEMAGIVIIVQYIVARIQYYSETIADLLFSTDRYCYFLHSEDESS